jgi:hypothetical protein
MGERCSSVLVSFDLRKWPFEVKLVVADPPVRVGHPKVDGQRRSVGAGPLGLR